MRNKTNKTTPAEEPVMYQEKITNVKTTGGSISLPGENSC